MNADKSEGVNDVLLWMAQALAPAEISRRA